MKRTRTVPVNLYQTFGGDKRALNAAIARMTVLYEDLRIEIKAASSDNLSELDKGSFNARRGYFIRRSIGTTYEFAECIRLLNKLPEFQTFKEEFDTADHEKWNSAVEFFREHERFIEQVRNDIGGHFGNKAALYAVANLSHLDAPGLFQYHYDDEGAGGLAFKFVEDIAAVALTRHKAKGESSKDFIERTFDLLVRAYKIAVSATHVVCLQHLAPHLPKRRRRSWR
jgi:hypothetical protein